MDQERLKELIHYDPDTGQFVNRRTDKVYSGVTYEGYRRIYLDRKGYRGGRLAWLYVHGEWPPEGMVVDHINNDPADDRIVNLRLATISQNAANQIRNRPLPKGVSVDRRKAKAKNKYKAQIQCRGITYCLGEFDTPEKAKNAYDQKQRELFGEFSRP